MLKKSFTKFSKKSSFWYQRIDKYEADRDADASKQHIPAKLDNPTIHFESQRLRLPVSASERQQAILQTSPKDSTLVLRGQPTVRLLRDCSKIQPKTRSNRDDYFSDLVCNLYS